MAERLGIPAERIAVVDPGLPLAEYDLAMPPQTPTIGFLSPAIPEKGLDRLLDAFRILRREWGLAALRLRVMGGCTAGSHPYIDDLQARVRDWGLGEAVEFLPNLGGPAKRAWLASLSVLSVPERRGEAVGLYVLEAAASGVPVVQPRHGGLVELVEAAGCGILVEPENTLALVEGLESLLRDTQRGRALGLAGRRAVAERFTTERAARSILGVWEQVRKSAPASL